MVRAEKRRIEWSEIVRKNQERKEDGEEKRKGKEEEIVRHEERVRQRGKRGSPPPPYVFMCMRGREGERTARERRIHGLSSKRKKRRSKMEIDK